MGHYRLDREDGVSTWTAWRGALQLDTRDQRVTVIGATDDVADGARGVAAVPQAVRVARARAVARVRMGVVPGVG